uniref:Uncharacterized protein n=1 Tax=Coccidioides posadasii RMSCC 3488 TaxID=454284 RepID=A0A0J6FG45_COCPO|nr:hypothetical protein CPAG_04644 [Coccidioides posadasii RMSCC 3488]
MLVGVVGPYSHDWLTTDTTPRTHVNLKARQESRMRVGTSATARDPVHGLLLEYIEGCTA